MDRVTPLMGRDRGEPRTSHLLSERRGRALWLTLNRPEKLNALTQDLYRDLRRALVQADLDSSIEKATLRLPEALRGMSDVYAACHLSAYVGVARAKYLLMTCRQISAREARDWGLIASVVPHDRLEQETERLVHDTLQTQPGARAWNKQLINAAALPPFDGRALKATMSSSETLAGTGEFVTKAAVRG